MHSIIQKENVLRAAQKELEKALSEQQSLKAVKKTQQQAMGQHTDEGGYDEKVNDLISLTPSSKKLKKS